MPNTTAKINESMKTLSNVLVNVAYIKLTNSSHPKILLDLSDQNKLPKKNFTNYPSSYAQSPCGNYLEKNIFSATSLRCDVI